MRDPRRHTAALAKKAKTWKKSCIWVSPLVKKWRWINSIEELLTQATFALLNQDCSSSFVVQSHRDRKRLKKLDNSDIVENRQITKNRLEEFLTLHTACKGFSQHLDSITLGWLWNFKLKKSKIENKFVNLVLSILVRKCRWRNSMLKNYDEE